VLILAAALAPVCLADNGDWVEVRSPHFSVVTNAGDKRGREVAQRFEQMRSVFGSLILHERVNIPIPLQIIAFKNSRGLRDFSPLWKGKPIKLAGLYQGGEDRNFILLDMSSEEPYETVFHEYAHLLLNGNYPETQPWFDEGFAEFYSTIKVTGKGVEIGNAPAGDLEVLAGNKFAPVLALFNVRQDSSVYNEDGDHRSMFYAQSWLSVHYLYDNKKMPNLAQYFELVNAQHVPMADAIQKAFGMDAHQFDMAIQKYYKAGRASLYTSPVPPSEPLTYASRRLSPADAEAVLADAHLHSRDYVDKAMSEFRQILAANPENSASHRGLGYAYLRKNDFQQAAPEFERAAQLDSADPRVFYYSALLKFRQGGESEVQPEALATMNAQLRRSVELDPQFADAYYLLSFVKARQGKFDEAGETIKSAIKLNPREPRYLLSLGSCLVNEGKISDAKLVFSRLINNQDPRVASSAADALARIATYESSGRRIVLAPNAIPENEPAAQPVRAPNTTGAYQAAASAPPPTPVDTRPMKFLKGTVLSIACSSSDNSATLNFAVAAAKRLKLWRMSTSDRKKLVLLSEDTFSCEWKNRKAAVNYREAMDGEGELVSLEMQ
jgi:tetratricopeptide (TPR) repeat protein